MSHKLYPDGFQSRARSLEEAFFQKRDAELIANLRSELEAFEEEHKLARVSGILDQKVLLDLVHAGVTAESLLAMRYVPMVMVAWADRSVSADERAAIMKAATDEHVTADSAAYRLIDQWLEQPPSPDVITAWKEYIGALATVVTPETLKSLQSRTALLCERVARATGGVLGFGKISAAEHKVIQEFVGTWSTN